MPIAMGKLEMLQWGSNQLRVGPWRGDATVAQVVPAPGQTFSVDSVMELLDRLALEGYASVLTPALSDLEQMPFLDAGFRVTERLHLLRRSLLENIDPPAHAVRLRRARRRDRPRVLEVDAAAFAPFWRFDERGLLDARAATPSSRFRVATNTRRGPGGRRGAGPPIAGYAVTGRAGGISYLQRLAVDPADQGRGIGTALVLDALTWARAHNCSSILVNTQESNETAVSLYEHLGFTREPTGLAVLQRELDSRADARAPG
jgi:ribosomal protein S18 acetylase RimI-like enzyme